MEVVPDRSARSLCGFVEAAVELGVVVVTEGMSRPMLKM
jgi:hypothetical protein